MRTPRSFRKNEHGTVEDCAHTIVKVGHLTEQIDSCRRYLDDIDDAPNVLRIALTLEEDN